MNQRSKTESGSVIFYILIAVALLAALSFAVARGGRGGSVTQLSAETVRLYASDIIEYGDALKKAVAQLRLRGMALSSLSFAHDDAHADYGVAGADPDNEIFDLEGGAVIYKAPPEQALASAGALYEFYGTNEIEEVGSTCGAASCADLLVSVSGLSEQVCIKINDLLGVSNPSDVPPVDTGMDMTTRFAGSFSYAAVIGDEAASAALAGKTAGCFYDTTATTYIYYQVLAAR